MKWVDAYWAPATRVVDIDLGVSAAEKYAEAGARYTEGGRPVTQRGALCHSQRRPAPAHTAIVTAAMMIPLQSKCTPVSDVKLPMLKSGRRALLVLHESDIPGQGGARSRCSTAKSRGHSPTFQGGAASPALPGARPQAWQARRIAAKRSRALR